MTARSVSWVVIVSLVVCAGTAFAQQSLGDFVANGGYEWILGRWAGAMDEGTIELEYKWGLDKHVVLTGVRMGDYRQNGMVMLDPDLGEVIGAAADNMGNTWKGDWTEEDGKLVYRLQQTTPTGEVNKMHLTHAKVDANSIEIAIYGLDSSGSRNSEPMGKLTYKRQPAAKATPVEAAAQSGRTADYETLGDLISQGGYDWMIGKWLATDDDGKYELEYKWGLNKHVVLTDLKIGDFTYHGMIMFNPGSQDIFQVGADSAGGVWNGTWGQSYEGALNRIEYSAPDGTDRKMEHLYTQDDNDTFKVKEYRVTDGTRASEPNRTLTFKRQKVAAPAK